MRCMLEEPEICSLKVQRKIDDSDFATSQNYGVASSLSSSKSICYPEVGITRIRGPREDYCLISKVNILNGHGQAGPYVISPYGKTLYYHMVG